MNAICHHQLFPCSMMEQKKLVSLFSLPFFCLNFNSRPLSVFWIVFSSTLALSAEVSFNNSNKQSRKIKLPWKTRKFYPFQRMFPGSRFFLLLLFFFKHGVIISNYLPRWTLQLINMLTYTLISMHEKCSSVISCNLNRGAFLRRGSKTSDRKKLVGDEQIWDMQLLPYFILFFT